MSIFLTCCLPSLVCVKLTDLVPCEGLPSNSYKLLVSTLSQLLAQYFKGQYRSINNDKIVDKEENSKIDIVKID